MIQRIKFIKKDKNLKKAQKYEKKNKNMKK